jgi:hypothetical protein
MMFWSKVRRQPPLGHSLQESDEKLALVLRSKLEPTNRSDNTSACHSAFDGAVPWATRGDRWEYDDEEWNLEKSLEAYTRQESYLAPRAGRDATMNAETEQE